MKKLTSFLVFFVVFKTVISATQGSCCTNLTAPGSATIQAVAKMDLSPTKKIQADIYPLDIFDLRFN